MINKTEPQYLFGFNKMNISNLYTKLALASPRMEVLLRMLYWNNYKLLNRYRPPRNIKPQNVVPFDFDNIIKYLQSLGIGEGSLVIVHSSFGALKGSGLTPDDIIDKLLGLVGPTGTLAMPVIRHYDEKPPVEEELKTNLDDVVSVYDVNNTKITTGVLPIVLHARKNSVTSRFPLNPLCAIGPLAKPMMADNLNGKSPHDEYSAWKFCHDHNAIIVGLGIDLAHYLTMIHVAEEAYPDWPIKDWFRKRNFIIKDGNFETEKTVMERKPKWGMLHLADKMYTNDFKKEGILIEKEIDSVVVGFIESKKLITYLNGRKAEGYPYVVRKKDFIKK